MSTTDRARRRLEQSTVEQATPREETRQAKQRAGEWMITKEWIAGLRVVTVNAHGLGTLLRLLAAWSAADKYDIVLAQEHHVTNTEAI